MSMMALGMVPKDHTVIVIGKTPDAAVKRKIVGMIKSRPSAFIALGEQGTEKEGSTLITGSIDAGVNYVLKAMGRIQLSESYPESIPRLKGRKLLRGLFVGGSLCYQAQAILGSRGINVYSNAPATKKMALPKRWDNVNICIDTGAEEYVKGRPHPMIDPVARNSMLVKESSRKDVAVLLFEVMLGWGSAMDPLAGLKGLKKGPLAIASICGTHKDKQDFEKVRRSLEDLGVVVFHSAGNAAEYAAKVMEGLK
jgi:FdrA protein